MRRSLLFLAVLVMAVLPLTAVAADGQFERTLKVTGSPQLEVSTGSGDITVHVGENGAVRVKGIVHVSMGWFSSGNDQEKVRRIESNPPIRQTGNMISIGKTDDPELRRNVSINYELWVPAETLVNAHSGSGNVLAENLKNSVMVSTGSGDVTVRNIANVVRATTGSGNVQADGVAGDFTGETGSGDVHVTSNAKGSVRAKTGSGNIEIANAKSGVYAHTGSGDVRAAGEPALEWNIETGSGNVHLQIPQNSRFDVNASTSSGHIDIPRQMTTTGTSSDRRHIKGKVNGGGALVQLHTGSGDIEVR